MKNIVTLLISCNVRTEIGPDYHVYIIVLFVSSRKNKRGFLFFVFVFSVLYFPPRVHFKTHHTDVLVTGYRNNRDTRGVLYLPLNFRFFNRRPRKLRPCYITGLLAMVCTCVCVCVYFFFHRFKNAF